MILLENLRVIDLRCAGWLLGRLRFLSFSIHWICFPLLISHFTTAAYNGLERFVEPEKQPELHHSIHHTTPLQLWIFSFFSFFNENFEEICSVRRSSLIFHIYSTIASSPRSQSMASHWAQPPHIATQLNQFTFLIDKIVFYLFIFIFLLLKFIHMKLKPGFLLITDVCENFVSY